MMDRIYYLAAACTGKNCLDSTNALNIPIIGVIDVSRLIISTLIAVTAVISTIFIVIGGIRYITADGNPQRVAGARQTITYAIVGLLVAVMATAIVGFVLANSPQVK